MENGNEKKTAELRVKMKRKKRKCDNIDLCKHICKRNFAKFVLTNKKNIDEFVAMSDVNKEKSKKYVVPAATLCPSLCLQEGQMSSTDRTGSDAHCPYDNKKVPSHVFEQHLMKCIDANPNVMMVRCIFNPNHVMTAVDYQSHFYMCCARKRNTDWNWLGTAHKQPSK